MLLPVSLFTFNSLVEQILIVLTLIEFTAQLMVGAPLHHLSDMLSFLVDRHGTNDSALGRRGHHLDLDGARLCNLAVQLLQFRGILLRDGPRRRGKEKKKGDIITFQSRTMKIPIFFIPFIATCQTFIT
jgi:hypothetical protein